MNIKTAVLATLPWALMTLLLLWGVVGFIAS
jgi:hypothetical protein